MSCGIFAPGLKLMPGALAQTGQRLGLGRFGKIYRRDASRAEERVHQRAIFGAETIHFGTQPRDFRLQQDDVLRAQ